MRGFTPRGAVDAFLKLSGGGNRELTLLGNDFTSVRQVVDAPATSDATAVRRSGNAPGP
jgi:hypothetical protein